MGNMSRDEVTEAMKQELKPCPFCGYTEVSVRFGEEPRSWCPNCDARGPLDQDAWGLSDDQKELPDNLWNRRDPIGLRALRDVYDSPPLPTLKGDSDG